MCAISPANRAAHASPYDSTSGTVIAKDNVLSSFRITWKLCLHELRKGNGMARKVRLLLFSALLIVLMAPSLHAQATAAGQNTSGMKASSSEGPALSSFLQSLRTGVPVAHSAMHRSAAKSRRGRVIPSGLPVKASCDQYTIDCLDGTGDSCCGSYSSCVSYCEEFCNVDSCS
jgi:hypothetical protein